MAIVKTEAYFHSSTGQHNIRTLIWREEELSPIGVFPNGARYGGAHRPL